MKKVLLLAAFTTLARATHAQPITIIPEPAQIIQPRIAAKFSIEPGTTIYTSGDELAPSVSFLNQYLKKQFGFTCPVKQGSGSGIQLKKQVAGTTPGSYQLIVNGKGVQIEGSDTGVFYGIQTLIQLLPTAANVKNIAIPYVHIKDAPRFAYRGLHLDVARHFFAVDFVKTYIDYLALHKLNYFHWHLTDDQGWRIEIKKYPRLTSVGAWRHGTVIGRYPGTGNDGIRHGGFYTQEQVKEVVKYAAERYITVIPEIEMPGHASAAIAAYPELSCFPDTPTIRYYPKESAWAGDSTGKQVIQSWGVYDDVFVPSEKTFSFLQDVIDEVLPLFPAKYIHIGGDECPKTNWKKSAFCQNLIREKGLTDEHGLQSYFIQRMEKYINGKGKSIIGWDEILEGGLAPNALVMSWRGEEGGIEAAKQNHQVIMTPGSHVYLDHSQTRNEDSVTIGGYTPLEKIYSYEPLPAELPADKASYILGAQANLWTEYVGNPQKVEYSIFPRVGALSEVLWSPKSKRNWEQFRWKIPAYFQRLDRWGANYSKAFYDVKPAVEAAAGNKGVAIFLEKPTAGVTTEYQFIADGKAATKALVYTKPVTLTGNGVFKVWNALNGKPAGATVQMHFNFNKATGKPVQLVEAPAKNWSGQGGVFGLVNGLRSTQGMSSSEWLGWEGRDMELVIDLQQKTRFHTVILHTISAKGSWVYPPAALEVLVSDDGKTFTRIGTTEEFLPLDQSTGFLSVQSPNCNARYVKLVAKNFGKIPAGADGAGHSAWLFADEIEIL